MTTKQASCYLRDALVPIYGQHEAAAMIAVIFDEVMHYSQVDVVLRADSELPEFVPALFEQIVARLQRHEPLQYIMGAARFHGHRFRVTPATLIPRPETEMLIDIIADDHRSATDLRVLDIGTGSGCIAVSLALALKFPIVSATDVSPEALDVARENARNLRARVSFIEQDILVAALPVRPCFDIIVSNPPYVCLSEQAQMEPNVLDYEPHIALFVTDDDPLLFYRAIIRYAAKALAQGGRLYLECNRRFTADVASIALTAGFSSAATVIDGFAAPRFVSAIR